jgi:nucleoid-associated protein YgaU
MPAGSCAFGMPAAAGAGAASAPQLRLVPGRIALFVAVLSLVAFLLVPRMMSTVSSVSAPQVHVVESGETLWGVAGEFGGDEDPRAYVHDLLELNRLSSPQVFPGQKLILP